MMPLDSRLVIATARSWIGTPYHHQSSVKHIGADCLGMVRGMWREMIGPEPTVVPAYTPDWGEAGAHEVLANGAFDWMIPLPIIKMQPGCLILFRMRQTAIAKHIAVLTDNDTIVHAYVGLGVIEESFTRAWRRRAAFAFQFPDMAAIKDNEDDK